MTVEEDEHNLMCLTTTELKASAGTGFDLYDDNSEKIMIEINPVTRQANFCVGVSGDSMEPLYYDGDMLLVREQPDVEIGEIGIFIINNQGFVKKKGKGVFISLNKKFKDISPTEFDNVKCCGKVLGRLEKEWIHA